MRSDSIGPRTRPARHRMRSLILAICVSILTAAQVHAAARPAVSRPLASPRTVTRSGGTSASTLCRLGESAASTGTLNIIDFSVGDDAYYTWLNLDSLVCTSCGANTYARLANAHVALYFPAAPETVQVSVNVVGVVPISCHYPNYLDPGDIVCHPFQATLDCQDSLTLVDFAIPFPPGTVLSQGPSGRGQAFLGFTFLSTTHPDSAHKPELATEGEAHLCRSFNPIGSVAYDVVFEYLVGNPVMYADVEKCSRLLDVGPGPDLVAPSLQAVLPNPVRSLALVRFSSGGFPDATLQVTDLAGRNVTSLASLPTGQGAREARWNLRDAGGVRVQPGVYWVVLHAGTHREARAIAVLP